MTDGRDRHAAIADRAYHAAARRKAACPFRVIVRLWVVAGEESGFRHFEDQAIDVMREHGARIVSVEQPDSFDPRTSSEVHVLEFPSRASFDSYRADARLAELAQLRERVVLRTEIELPDRAG